MASLLVLAAFFALSICIVRMRLRSAWITRSWTLVLAGCALISCAALAGPIPGPAAQNVLVMIGAIVATASSSIAWFARNRIRWTTDALLEMLVSLIVTLFAGWIFVLQPLHVNGAAGTTLLAGIVLVMCLCASRVLLGLVAARREALIVGWSTAVVAFATAGLSDLHDLGWQGRSPATIDIRWLAAGLGAGAALLAWVLWRMPSRLDGWGATESPHFGTVLGATLGPITMLSFASMVTRSYSSAELWFWVGAVSIATLAHFLVACGRFNRSEHEQRIKALLATLETRHVHDRTTDMHELLEALVEEAARLFNAQRIELVVEPDHRAARQRMAIQRGLTDTEQAMLTGVPALDPMAVSGRVNHHGSIVINRNDTILSVAARSAWAAVGKSRVLVVPIRTAHGQIGLLEAWTPNNLRDPGHTDWELARAFGAAVGDLLERAHHLIHSRAQAEQGVMLQTVSEVFSRGQSLDACLIQVAERLAGHASADRITIALVSNGGAEMCIAAEVDVRQSAPAGRRGLRFPSNEWSTFGQLAGLGGPVWWSRAQPGQADTSAVLEMFDAESMFSIPGYLNGALSVIVQVIASTPALAESTEVRATWHQVARQIQLGMESVGVLQESQRRERLELMRRRINEALQAVEHINDSYDVIGRLFHRVPDVNGATVLSWNSEESEFVVESDWAEPPIATWQSGTAMSIDRLEIFAGLERSHLPRVWWLNDPEVTETARTRLTAANTGSAIAVPLRIEDRLIGGLLLVSHRPNCFSDETLELAVELASTLALVVNAIDLRRREAEHLEEQDLKLRLLAAATSKDDPGEALEAIAMAGLGRAGAESIDIAFWNQEADTMVIATDTTLPDWPGVEAPGTVLPILPGSIQEQSLRTARMARFRSTDGDLNPWAKADIETFGAGAWLALPMVVEGRVIGLIQVLSRDPKAFSERLARLWVEISRQIAPIVRSLEISLENQRLSFHKDLVARINEIAASSPSPAETWQRLAQLGLLDGIGTASIYHWYGEEALVLRGGVATIPGCLAGEGGMLEEPLLWTDEPDPVRPRPLVHLFRTQPDLDAANLRFLDEMGAGAVAIYMLVDDGQVHGALLLRSADADGIPAATLEDGTVLAANLGPVIRNLIARENERRTEREQQVLVEIASLGASCDDIRELYAATTDAMRNLLGGAFARLYLVNRTAGTVDLAAESNSGTICTPLTGQRRWTTTEPPLPRSFLLSRQARSSTATEQAEIDGRADQDSSGPEIASCVVLPMSIGKGDWAQLVVGFTSAHPLLLRHIRSAEAICNQAANTIDRARARAEEQLVAEHRAVLLRVSQASNAISSLDAVLAEITTASLGVATSESCAIELYDEEFDSMVIGGLARVTDWVIPEHLLGKSRPFGSWAIDHELRDSRTVVINSIADPRVTGHMRADMERFQTESIVAHALFSGGAFIGTFNLFARNPDAYTERDLWTTSEIADRVVASIQNARRLESERLLSIERERLLQISEAATSTLETRAVLQEIAQSTIGLAGAESCHIELIDWEKREFRTEAYATVLDWDQGDESQIGMRFPIGRWSIDHDSITSTEVITITSQDDPRVTGQLREDMIAFNTQSMLIIPIWLRGSCIGVLNLYSRRARAFTADQKTLAATLAKQAANAIQNSNTHEQERARRSQQEVLVRFAAAATSSLDLNRSMQALCEAIHAVTGVDSATIGIHRPEADGFEIAADFTVDDWDYRDVIGSIYTRADFPIFSGVLGERAPLRMTRSGERGFADFAPIVDPDLDALALVPLWLNDHCLGYVGLFDRNANQLNDSVIDLIAAACPTVTLALSNALQWRDEQVRSNSRAAVVAVGRIALSDAPITEKLAQTAAACVGIHRIDVVKVIEANFRTDGITVLAAAAREPTAETDAIGLLQGASASQLLNPDQPPLDSFQFAASDSAIAPELRDVLKRCGESVAFFTLGSDGDKVRLLVFISKQPYEIPDETMQIGHELATQISLVISSAMLHDETRRYSQAQSALLSANRSVMAATETSLRDVLNQISCEIMDLINADCCEIEYLIEGHNATQLMVQVEIVDGELVHGEGNRILPLSEWPVTGRVLQELKPILLDRQDTFLTDSERASFFGAGTESVVIAPMMLNDRPTGIISFYSPEKHFFTQEAIKLAIEFGSLAALAIDRAQTNKALSEEATRDALTGVLNRRALNDWLDHQIALTDRNEDVFSILMIDLNEFKVINDTYGHLVGDNVLREVATAMQNALRTSDLLGRYGGDEFLAILPSTDLVQALSLAERLTETLSASPIRLAGGQEVIPSLSIGTAAYPVSARDREGMIEVADRAMYAVKQAGLSGDAAEQSKLADAVGMSVAS